MRVQSLNHTLIDKVFAVCDYYLLGKAHRIEMGSEIAPAAPLDVDILELVQKICEEDFYKEDYRETKHNLTWCVLLLKHISQTPKRYITCIFIRPPKIVPNMVELFDLQLRSLMLYLG